ncbi:MAG TPA: hypothetical protein VLN49_03305 [Gemmatimonadaceae bacterium]|nr:hypothetical protein [Gemmatimonadaceae bacterium]
MKNLIVAIGAISVAAGLLPAQRARHVSVVWPERLAVGMRQGTQLPPLMVEATKTGWVTISFFSTRPDEGLNLPASRMIAQARDVKLWVARSRRLLETPDSATSPGSTSLGNGAYQLEIQRPRYRPQSPLFSWRACGPGYGTAGPATAELLDFLALLDSAATMAGEGEGRPPTLSRPYYASEVSCSARASADNVRPGAPLRASAPEIAAQFVVDTSGLVELLSIRFLAATSPVLANAARAAIRNWHFQPAEIDGTPVRQLVQTTVPFAARPLGRFADGSQIGAEGTADGWVHVFRVSGVNGELLQQWFDPDSIDAWLARVWRRDPRANEPPVDTAVLLQGHFPIGPRSGVSITGSVMRNPDHSLEMIAGFNGCAGAFNEGGQRVGQGEIFADAARQARAGHQPPIDPTGRLYDARNVACPAWLPWTRSRISGFERVWRYPVAPYPASMRPTNARADVLVSFVVDTSGAAEPNSIVVMGGSDPRAAAAVPTALAELRYRPATRSGYKVRQRVIQTLRFEPPPVCLDLKAGPACPRRYSPN